MPQLALQQVRPSAHVTRPHGSPVRGSQLTLSPSATHCVPPGQRTVAHGSVTIGSHTALLPTGTQRVSTGQSTAAHGLLVGTQLHTSGEASH